MSLEKSIFKNFLLMFIVLGLLLSIFLIGINFRESIKNDMEFMEKKALLLEKVYYRDRELFLKLLEEDSDFSYDFKDSQGQWSNMDRQPDYRSLSLELKEGQLTMAMENSQILSNYLYILPLMLILVFIFIWAALYLIHRKSRELVEPIDRLSLRIYDDDFYTKISSPYRELNPFLAVINSRNIEIKKLENKIREEGRILEDIYSYMEEGLILLSKKKEILLLNSSSLDYLLGQPSRNYIMENFSYLSRDYGLNQAIDQSIADHKNREFNLEEGASFYTVYINPVLEDGELLGLILLLIDRTEEKKLADLRRDFSSNVSHELKSPLTSIIGYAELLENQMARPEDIAKFGHIIKREGDRLLEIIDNIIRLSKLEDENRQDDFRPLRLEDLVEASLASLDLGSIRLEKSYEDLKILADGSMVQEAIRNLLENILLHSQCENISIRTYRENNKNYLSIADDGIGISKKDQARIFERFYIVDKSRSRNKKSTGLGLSIVKHIMEHHGGSIKLLSPNKGTEFLLEFPSF